MPDKSTQQSAEANETTSRGLLAVGCIGLAVVGMAQALYGPALSDMRERASVTAGDLGLMTSLHFVGAVAAMVAWSAVSNRRRGEMWRLCLAMLAAGSVGLATVRPIHLLFVSASILGFGCGGLIVSLNAAAARQPDLPTRWLNGINSSFAFGAALVLGLAVPLKDLAPTYFFIAAVSVGLLMFPHASILVNGLVARGGSGETRSRERNAGPRLLIHPHRPPSLLLGCAALLISYVALESTMGAWAPTWMIDDGSTSSMARLYVTLFWMVFGIGRLIGSMVVVRIGPRTLIPSLLALCVLLFPLFWTPYSEVAFLLVGLLLGPIYPSTVGWLVSSSSVTNRWLGLLLTAPMVGGILALYAVGLLVDQAGSGLAVPLAWTAMLLCTSGLAVWLAYRARGVVRT